MWLALAGAAIGAVAGIFSKKQRAKQEQRAIEQQKKNAWQQYLYGKEYSDEMFGIQKEEALGQLDTQQKNLDTQVGLSTDEYNTALMAQAFGIQDARIQTASQTGMSLADEGAGGTRGNSNNAMIRAYAEQGLERDIEVQESQNKNQLNSLVTGANMQNAAIEHERSTWMPGGYRVKQKDAQDAYNMNMARLGQANFDWHIKEAEPTMLDYAAGGLSGAISGMQFGHTWDVYINKWGKAGGGGGAGSGGSDWDPYNNLFREGKAKQSDKLF